MALKTQIRLIQWVSIIFLLLSSSTYAVAGAITDIEKNLEQKRMHRLADAKQGQIIKPFTSDGCSGGLSTGWEYFADQFPKFSTRFGNTPPWQQCCVMHDKSYWKGEVRDGYEQRKKADRALRVCVENSGSTLKTKPENNLSDKVSLSLKVTAQLMYRAVRLGGKPCSIFPWRWGYGWPKCGK